MDACYIARRNAISASALQRFQERVEKFHELREAFITCDVRKDMKLPREHAFNHYHSLIQYFGSPNGLCSSITESEHKESVKHPWGRSNRFKAIAQMVVTLLRLHKMAAARQRFASQGMLKGTTASYMAGVVGANDPQEDLTPRESEHSFPGADEEGIPVDDVRDEEALSLVTLCVRTGASVDDYDQSLFSFLTESGYPRDMEDLAVSIQLPSLPIALRQFLFLLKNPDSTSAPSLSDLPQFHGRVYVHYSALATFFAPSDLCGVGGMHKERIRSTPSWYDHPRHDTVFVVLDDSLPGMDGMVIARVRLLFSFNYKNVDHSCALVNWLVREGDKPDPDTGMWVVSLEKENGVPTTQVIDVKTIVRAAHLIPVFGSEKVPSDVYHYNSLDRYRTFFINKYADHHSHELLTDNYQ